MKIIHLINCISPEMGSRVHLFFAATVASFDSVCLRLSVYKITHPQAPSVFLYRRHTFRKPGH